MSSSHLKQNPVRLYLNRCVPHFSMSLSDDLSPQTLEVIEVLVETFNQERQKYDKELEVAVNSMKDKVKGCLDQPLKLHAENITKAVQKKLGQFEKKILSQHDELRDSLEKKILVQHDELRESLDKKILSQHDEIRESLNAQIKSVRQEILEEISKVGASLNSAVEDLDMNNNVTRNTEGVHTVSESQSSSSDEEDTKKSTREARKRTRDKIGRAHV